MNSKTTLAVSIPVTALAFLVTMVIYDLRIDDLEDRASIHHKDLWDLREDLEQEQKRLLETSNHLDRLDEKVFPRIKFRLKHPDAVPWMADSWERVEDE